MFFFDVHYSLHTTEQNEMPRLCQTPGCKKTFVRIVNLRQHEKVCGRQHKKARVGQPICQQVDCSDQQMVDIDETPDDIRPGNKTLELELTKRIDQVLPEIERHDAALLKLQLEHGLSNGTTSAFARSKTVVFVIHLPSAG